MSKVVFRRGVIMSWFWVFVNSITGVEFVRFFMTWFGVFVKIFGVVTGVE